MPTGVRPILSSPKAEVPRVDRKKMEKMGSEKAEMSFLRDLSLSAVVAGFVTVLVGFTSSAVIVFQAANAVGAGPAEIASWMWALGLGMGITCIALSLRYRMPVVTAWPTPGAAMLITGAKAYRVRPILFTP